MKPYGLKRGKGGPNNLHGGDGRICAEVEGSNKRAVGVNKYCRLLGGDEHGPKGKHRERKIHDQKRACHAVARAEERKLLFDLRNTTEDLNEGGDPS